MRACSRLLLAAALATASACGDPSSDSLVVVTVTASPAMPAVSQLKVNLTNFSDAALRRTDTELFPQTPSPNPLTFDASFALAVPKTRSGDLEIVVDALDAAATVVATGTGRVTIRVGRRVDLTIHLGPPSEADAGAGDAGPGEAGPPRLDSATADVPTTVDLAMLDGPLGEASGASADTGGMETPPLGGTGGAGGSGGAGGTTGSTDGGVDGGGAGSGGAKSDGASDQEVGPDMRGAGGAGGVSSTGGAGGIDAGLDRAGAGGTGGTDASINPEDAAGDAPLPTCSATASCPTYPKCRVQPTCDIATGLCSQPSECSVCGNGLLEFSEQCDDGNTISGDHCSSTCKWESCGDGIVQSYSLASLSLIYLARSCGMSVAQDIWLMLNGVELVRGVVQQTCDCQPGIVTLPVTNPAFKTLANNGPNVVEVHTAAEISWAVAHFESPSGPGDVFLVDYGQNGAAQYRRPNLCTNGSQPGAEVGTTMTLAGGEQCDHGNQNGTPGDSCTANCLVQ